MLSHILFVEQANSWPDEGVMPKPTTVIMSSGLMLNIDPNLRS